MHESKTSTMSSKLKKNQVRVEMPELDWSPIVPDNIEKITPYPPGKPIEETRREYGLEFVVKLASNENPLGPSPKALKVMKSNLEDLNLYPDSSHFELKSAIAKKYRYTNQEIAIGCGSNELIDLLIRVYCPEESNIIVQEKAFVAYKLCAELSGCHVIEAKVDSNFKVSSQAILKVVNPLTRIIFIANPNNPTGTYLDRDELKFLADELDRQKILLVIDYAYWEYVTDPSIPDPIEMFSEHPNVIILRTFSKIYGLAGLRVGYMVARKEITKTIEKSRQPFNVSSLGMDAAIAALSDDEFVKRSAEENIKSIKGLKTALKLFDVRVFPPEQNADIFPQTNFLLVDFKKQSKDLYPEFLKRGVIIRPVTNYGLPTFFRITAGLSGENAKLLQAMSEIIGEKK